VTVTGMRAKAGKPRVVKRLGPTNRCDNLLTIPNYGLDGLDGRDNLNPIN
jgi:hypothetical protein